jgi:formylglycine-generating enzyme required for sulfatase activity
MKRRRILALAIALGGADAGLAEPVRMATGLAAQKHFRDCAACPEMVVLPAGTYRMGSAASEPGRSLTEGIRAGVRIPAFAMGRFEVTVAQYAACVDAGSCVDPHWKEERAHVLFGVLGASVRQPSHPVTGVSWNMAQDYVNWLSRVTGARYTVPSETQWEYAARARTSTRWSFGDNPGFAGVYAWYDGNSGRTLRPVGSRKPNRFGLHDMHGSVWEWTQDCYEVWYGYDHWDPRYNQAPHDEKAWETQSCISRVMRGGSWNDPVERLRSAERSSNYAGHMTPTLGIRVARMLGATRP